MDADPSGVTTKSASGNRVIKDHYATDISSSPTRTYYIRDAQGNVMGIFKRASGETYAERQETPIYGSSRLGVSYKGALHTAVATDTLAHFNTLYTRELRQRGYELTDHLGNVRATVSDMLLPRGGGVFDADLRTLTDYYPFGMTMPERSYEAAGINSHRYGYNGKENDNEVKGEGNQQDYGFRIYDPRVARFLSVDPLARSYPELTTYQFASNQPIWAIDRDGLERFIVTLRTFIPEMALSNPNQFIGPASFAGDSRDFYALYSASYRTEQKLKVDFDAGIISLMNNTASATHGWDAEGNAVEPSSSAFAGSVAYSNQILATQDGVQTEETRMSSADSKLLSARLHFIVDASNKLVSGAPAINAELTLSIYAEKDGSFRFTLQGQKDGFPAYELWVKELNTNSVHFLFGSNPVENGRTPWALTGVDRESVNVTSTSESTKSDVKVPFRPEK